MTKTTKYTVDNKESEHPKYAISDVMPYPINKKTGNCSFCKRDNKDHHYMDFFLLPQHVKVIRDFFYSLKMKLDKTKIAPVKMAENSPKNILSPRDTQMELLKKYNDPEIANYIIQHTTFYTPYGQTARIHHAIKENLNTIITHFEGFTLTYEIRFREHEEPFETEETSLKELFEKVTDTTSDSPYQKFLKAHERHATHDYHYIQKWSDKIAADVDAHVKLAEEYLKEGDPLDKAASLNERKYLQGGGSGIPSYPIPYRYPRQRPTRMQEE